jgi:cation transport ATPase
MAVISPQSLLNTLDASDVQDQAWYLLFVALDDAERLRLEAILPEIAATQEDDAPEAEFAAQIIATWAQENDAYRTILQGLLDERNADQQAAEHVEHELGPLMDVIHETIGTTCLNFDQGLLSGFQDEQARAAIIAGQSSFHAHFNPPDPGSEAYEAFTNAVEKLRDYVLHNHKDYKEGPVGRLLKRLGAPETVLDAGRHYDDMVRDAQGLMARAQGNADITPRWRDAYYEHSHEVGDLTHTHLHDGAPLREVGPLAAIGVATALISDNAKFLPYPVRVMVEALGAWPFLNRLVRNQLRDAVNHVREGDMDEMHGVIKSGLALLLAIPGIAKRDGSEELLSVYGGWSALALVGDQSHELGENLLGSLFEWEERLSQIEPEVALEGATTTTAIQTLQPGQRILIQPGAPIPVDCIVPMDAAPIPVRDASHGIGESQALRRPADYIPQAAVLDGDEPRVVEVKTPYDDSYATQMVKQQRDYKPSKQQTLVQNTAKWAPWFTLLLGVGTAIHRIATGNPLGKIISDVSKVMAVGSFCNILAAPYGESAALRHLPEIGLHPNPDSKGQAQAQEEASKTSAYVLDWHNTITDPEALAWDDALFFDNDGQPLQEDAHQQMLAQVAALGLHQSPDYALHQALQAKLKQDDATWDAVQREHAALDTAEKTAETGQGIAAKGRQPIAVGRLGHLVKNDTTMPEAIKEHLITLQTEVLASSDHSRFTLVRTDKGYGIMRYTSHVREEAINALKQMIQQADRHVYIATGSPLSQQMREVAIAAGIPQNKIDHHIRHGLTPHEKAEFVKHLTNQGRQVAVVGDDSNDQPMFQEAAVSYTPSQHGVGLMKRIADFRFDHLGGIAAHRDYAGKVKAMSRASLAGAVANTAGLAGYEASGKSTLPLPVAVTWHEGVTWLVMALQQGAVNLFGNQADNNIGQLQQHGKATGAIRETAEATALAR